MATAIRGYKNQKRIMKKEYIKPEMVVEEMLLESSILALSVGEGEDDKPADAPGRREGRGTWGNLWSEKD